jgi:hypothetical protein
MKVENLHVVSSQKECIEGDVSRGAETIGRRIMRGHVDDGVAISLIVAMSTIEVPPSGHYAQMGHLERP